MAKTDVVKHDLTALLAATELNLDEIREPIPFPKGKKKFAAEEILLVEAPVTTLVSDEDRVKAPYRSVGLMGIIPNTGTSKSGSGWVIANKAFITAGHCVCLAELGGWIKKARFAPRYNVVAGKVYDVSTVYTLKGWVDEEDHAYDMAACVVTEKFAETEPPLKYQDGIFPPGKFAAIGYPIRPIPGHDFNGKRMWKCVGEFIKESGDMWWAANNLTIGASGGPWCDADNITTVYGLTSSRKDDSEVAYSPILLNGLENLYNTVKNL